MENSQTNLKKNENEESKRQVRVQNEASTSQVSTKKEDEITTFEGHHQQKKENDDDDDDDDAKKGIASKCEKEQSIWAAF
ncbi:hypothetical protein QVD17_15906 [Tagetes erecta]|uniref:Uncharacterized protein n=1 Tax=Tagetes erecta TaxID=13708 RepID=A0AAD8KT87_TARER|nr:hypothetical protein QVD17_15906 [Tagetes erecta]